MSTATWPSVSLNKDGMFDLVVRRDGQKVKLTDFPMEQREYADQSGGTYTATACSSVQRRRALQTA